MTASVIGALRANLGLNSAKFQSGARGVKGPLAEMKRQFKAVAAQAAAFGAVLSAVALKSAQDIDQSAKAAWRLGASVGGYRALELAASEAGVSLSSLTNELQSIDREIASIGKSGNADRALEALGLQASELSGVDADEKLAIIADRVKGLGLSAGEATALLRDLGVRNREMVLLVLQGGDAIRAARQDVEDYGLALSKTDSAAIETANDRIARLGNIGRYVGQQLAVTIVPRLGELAKAITDSLREGGALRTVIDALVGSFERLATYLAVAVVGFGARFVGALVLAKVAAFNLAKGLAAVKVALLRTGIFAVVVLAGELVFQFTRLVTAAGGFSKAMALLGDLAVDVLDRMMRGGALLVDQFHGYGMQMQAAYANAFAGVVEAFASMTGALADGWNRLMSKMGLDTNVSGLGAGLAAGMRKAADSLTASANAYSTGLNQAWSDLAGEPLESVARIKEVIDETKTAMGEGSTAAADLAGSLAEVDMSGGGAASKLGEVSDAAKAAEQRMESFKGSVSNAFQGLITGANDLNGALSSVLNSLAGIFAQRAVDGLFGGLTIPGFATGTPYAPGGLSMVGERGPELVRLPRGAEVIPNHRLGQQGTPQHVHVTFGVDGDGNITPFVDRRAGLQIARATPGIIGAQDRRLADSISNYRDRKG